MCCVLANPLALEADSIPMTLSASENIRSIGMVTLQSDAIIANSHKSYFNEFNDDVWIKSAYETYK